MIDLKTERLIPLGKARGMFGERRGSGLVSRATLHRWINEGRLEVARVGRSLYTTEDAIRRFIELCTAEGAQRTALESAGTTVAQRSRKAVQAAADAKAALYPEAAGGRKRPAAVAK